MNRLGPAARSRSRLLAAGGVGSGMVLVLLVVTRALLGWPGSPAAGVAVAALPFALAAALSFAAPARRRADDVLVHTVAASVATVVGAAAFVVVVVGLGRPPEGRERPLVLLAVLGSAAAALAFDPLRQAVAPWARARLTGAAMDEESVLAVFGRRIRRDIPLAEVLLQSAETLRRSMGLDAAEIWTGRDGMLERTASVPERPARSLAVDPETSRVAARAGVAGPAWLRVWMPDLAVAAPDVHVRAVPLGFGGELLGLVLVERGGARDFNGAEEEVLAELGRQMGLALHNAQLDLALQDTLDEVRRQAEELQASRRRLVHAADGERRRIERDLHDGAQQRLVTLAVNLRLARDMVGDTPAGAVELLDQLHQVVADTVEEVRSLAHGIYPPLLADSGLAAALRATAALSPGRVTVEAGDGDVGRYPADIEAAVYFCCLEAVQNATKHAPGAGVAIRLWADAGGLLFEVTDDGPGFDAAAVATGASQGFTNMADRLGAIGGTVRWDSSPGHGVRVSGAVPVGGISQ